MSDGHCTLTGHVPVPLPPPEALRLFTPRGEEEWIKGWRPRFPVPAPDDSRPGTVFETDSHGERTIWVVADRQEGHRISYARVTPGSRAGTVTVTAVDDGHGGTTVEVTYELTALSPQGARELRGFADGYADFLGSWERAIAARLASPNAATPT
ncbi:MULTISPECIES: SRPBCC family protein [Nonomuraea]|uniref:SRPBCC family protein n=2 Tax=Nonomuraea TaxID=83681 RepID=A0ABW1BSZ9_9ACTN|nr:MULTISPECIES: SRPBCC family protein [Nonomuraea]MDA0643321.1 SRPBCC family protein [Nonomuraea ferruginea]TXK38861.1 SRPBCC family protein [Nonomuraea sp. C10]